MRRFFILLTFILILIGTATANAADIILSEPVIKSPGFFGKDMVYVYAYNTGTEDVKLSFSSKDHCIAKTVKGGSGTVMSIGCEAEGEEFSVYRTDTGEQLPMTAAQPGDAFETAWTNMSDGFPINGDIIIDLNSYINKATADNIIIKLNKKIINPKLSIVDGDNGFSRLIWSFEGIQVNCGDSFEVTIPESVKDVFGRKIKTEKYVFSTYKPEERFEVFQKSEIITQKGIGGVTILADFGSNAPGEIYISRTMFDAALPSTPCLTHSSVSVTDPCGKRAAFYDFTDADCRRTDVILNVPYAAEGIWQIRFVSGTDKDVVEFGINGASSWGIRGECVLGVTETTPKTGYIYVPDKVNAVYLASVKNNGFSLSDLNGNTLIIPTACSLSTAKYSGIAEDIESGVYEVNLSDDFRDGFIVDIAPSLICPTPEMALALKGGWTESEGVLCRGAVQAQARAEVIRLLNTKKLEIKFEKPAYTSWKDLKYAMAEAQLFGLYGAITPLNDQVLRQNLNHGSPYCGTFVPDTTPTWEGGEFILCHDSAFSAIVNMDAQLNAFYKNEALIYRTAMCILANVSMISEDFIIREGKTCGSYPTTHGNFAFRTLACAYADIREYLEEQTVSVLDRAFMFLAEKQGNYYGQGPTNQWFFSIGGVAAVYDISETEHIHRMLTHQIDAIQDNYGTSVKGQSEAGYFIEAMGCDGDYHNLGQAILFTMYKRLKALSDDENVAKLKKIIDKNLEFDSLFYLPQPEGIGYIGVNSFTSRKENPYGKMTHVTYPIIMDKFPLAKRAWLLNNMPESGLGSAGTFPYYVNSDEWAGRVIDSWYSLYDKGKTGYSSGGNIYSYEAFKTVNDTPNIPIPCESASGMWDKPGIIAVKHKGLYMNIFYAVSEGNVPDIAFMGGGITALWAEGTGIGVVSRKHDKYENIISSEQVKATCLFGTKSDGSMFVSGKETAGIEHTDMGKEFVISGEKDDISVLWKYKLTDTGIRMTASYSGEITDVWLNIPIPLDIGADISVSDEKVIYSYNGNSIEFTPHSDFMLEECGEVTCLRVKLSDAAAEVDMRYISTSEFNGIMLENVCFVENMGDEAKKTEMFSKEKSLKAIQATVVNNTQDDITADFIYAMYDETGNLCGMLITKASLPGKKKTVITTGINSNASKIKLLIWDSVESMKPIFSNICNEL